MKLLIGIWNMKRSQVGITFLGTLVASLLFSGCQQSVPASSATATRQAFINEVSTFAVQTVIASFPSETPTPSITPTPTETPVVATWLIRSGLHSKKHEAVDNLVLSTI
jgi:hypothetical protein